MASIRSRRREPDGDGRAGTGCEQHAETHARRTTTIVLRLHPSGRAMATILLLMLLYGFPLYWIVTMSFKPPAEWNPPGGRSTGGRRTGRRRTTRTSSASRGQDRDLRDGAVAIGASRYIENSIIAATGGTLLALFVGVLRRLRDRALPRRRHACCPSRSCSSGCSRRSRSSSRCCSCSSYLASLGHALGPVILYGAVTFPFVVWLMRSFFQEVPREISRCGDRRRLHALGRVLQGRAAAGARAGSPRPPSSCSSSTGRDFLIALVMTQDKARTAPVFLQALQSGSAGPGVRAAGRARRHPDPAARDLRSRDPEVPRPRPHLRRDQALAMAEIHLQHLTKHFPAGSSPSNDLDLVIPRRFVHRAARALRAAARRRR